jgi:hypothetical protein
MATTTPNYGWVVPTSTDLVKDGATAIETLGDSVDATVKALNPETTLGDIAYRSATANTNTRLGIGTTGQILTVSGGVPAWAAPAASGSTLLDVRVNNYGSNYSTTSTSFVDVNASLFYLTITAPASGNVVLRASMPIEFNGGGQAIFNWREGSTDLTNTNFIAVNNGSSFPRAGTHTFNAYLTGVTAGSHTYKLGFRSTSGATFFGYTNSSPFLLEAWSA